VTDFAGYYVRDPSGLDRLWTVFDGWNGGEPVSDHASEVEAAGRVIALNA